MTAPNHYLENEGRGFLVGRLPQARQWEPIIVTTLRRYVRKGASERLLHRLAGGRRSFALLNHVWDLDDRALRSAVRFARDDLGDLPVRLSAEERRMALYQVIVEHVQSGRMMPSTWRLARYFGTTRGVIDADIATLRDRGLICITMVGARESRVPQVRLLAEVSR